MMQCGRITCCHPLRGSSKIKNNMSSVSQLVQIELSPMPQAKPAWLKARAPVGENFHGLKKWARPLQLHRVCEWAQSPNMGGGGTHRTATFMLLGDICT